MGYVLILGAILAGVSVLIKAGTGTLTTEQVLAIGVIFVALAYLVPDSWNHR